MCFFCPFCFVYFPFFFLFFFFCLFFFFSRFLFALVLIVDRMGSRLGIQVLQDGLPCRVRTMRASWRLDMEGIPDHSWTPFPKWRSPIVSTGDSLISF